MLPFDALEAAAEASCFTAGLQFGEFRIVFGHRGVVYHMSGWIVCKDRPMPAGTLDTGAVARLLAQVADQPEDRAEAYFERRRERSIPPEGEASLPAELVEEGFAVRLVRDGRCWHASRDGVDSASFVEALRQVARAQPRTAWVEPELAVPVAPARASLDAAEEPAEAGAAGWDTPGVAFSDPPPWRDFCRRVEHAIRAHHVAFPNRLALRQIERTVQVVGARLVPEVERESFFSVQAELPWGRCGALLWTLDEAAAETLGNRLVGLFRARFAEPPEVRRGVLVLGPDAAAVLLHEAVAHALEADLLALSGRPEAALGVRLGAACLNVLDDPGAAPAAVRRTSDDEGSPVLRRWLLRDGVVEQPLADGIWADRSLALQPGAARRAHRHVLPGPRSSYLELLPGETAMSDLLHGSDSGLYVPELSRGALDPLSGVFTLLAPYARRLEGGEIGDYVGPCRVRAAVFDLLTRVTALGLETQAAGAGWCAKGGQALPVWARSPAMRIEGVEVLPV